MKIDSKWSYVITGVNVMIALFGAIFHSGSLLALGIVFTIWNWVVAEVNRRIEDESIRKSVTQTKE